MQQIGRYRIVNELGRGAMGIVYRALDPAIGRTVAIKTFRLSDLADPTEREKIHGRLFREAHSAGILSHPGIVTIYDIAEEGDLAYIAMEFVNGPTLEKLMQADPPPVQQQILRILRETAAALDYAHQKGIIHRDIKPANIMMNELGSVKITDFGVAKILSHNLTQGDTILGTPNYMSPEQIEAKGLDGRSDQFALAVIAYELLTGEKPFVADSLPTLIFKIVREEPLAPQHLNPTIGGAVGDVIRKALSKSREQRHETCAEFVAALEATLVEQPGWKPQAKGALSSMATVVAAAPPAPAPREPEIPPRDDPDAATFVPSPPKEGGGPGVSAAAQKAAETLPEPPKLGVRHREPPARAKARYAILAVALVALAGAGFFGWRQFSAAGEGAVPPAAEQTPPPPAAEPAKPEEIAATGTQPSAMPETPASPPPVTGTVKPAAQPATVTPVDVEIVTTPPGATIVFDRDEAKTCTSPCSMSLPPGRHVFAATMAGYRPATRIFELPKESEHAVTLERQAGTVMVSTTPAGATIVVNGQTWSQKTPTILTLPAGRHRIELTLAGYPPYEEAVEVKDGVSRHLSIGFGGR
jgi:tRNA A-37 threonylcarbamoyl transferase component Bud32